MDPAKRGASLEEDDEFEDFKIENWNINEQQLTNSELWDKDWDDKTVNDGIGQQIRQLVQSLKASVPVPQTQ